jgi:MarR family transcriptional regulator, organic hydroperoxide resistance regulator
VKALDKATLIKEIVELQRQVNRDMREHTLGAWMELNLTIPQVKSLFFIANQGTTNFTRLAAALGVTPANVTGIIDRLVEHDLVSRQENPDDRRSSTLRVTEKGENTIANLRERRVSHTTRILSNLKVEELNAILQGFRLFVEAAAAYSGKQETKKV